MNAILFDVAKPDVVILANGAEPSGDAVELLRGARAVVACDGAVRTAQALGREVDFAVGDGDSISEEIKVSLGERFVQVCEQETNDLSKAFYFACDNFPAARTFVILGAHGLREDHLLGNISRLPGFVEYLADKKKSRDVTLAMVTDTGRFDVVMGRKGFKADEGDVFSVFAFRPGVKVRSEGLQWPLDGVSLDELWMGTLNRAAEEAVVISSDAPVVVFRPF